MDIFDKNIIGYDNVKNTLRQVVDMINRQKEYAKRGVIMPSGLLLNGSPGTGKSTLCNCFIDSCKCNSTSFRKEGEEFLDDLKAAFELAKNAAPCIIKLDDIHQYADSSYSSEWAGLQSAIDECKGKGVFVIATANYIDRMPDSLLRPGRFDYILHLNDPKGSTAEKIIAHYLKGANIGNDVSISDITKLLDGHSCAALETALNIARANAVYDNSHKIYKKHIVPAILQVVHQMRKSDTDSTPEELFHCAIHEASHAVVNEILMPGSAIVATLYTVDDSMGGMEGTLASGFRTEQTIIDLATICLAGKAGVESFLGIIDTGAGSDIDRACDIIYRWARDCASGGFSLQYPEYHSSSSDLLKHTQESIISSKLQEAYNRARKILLDNREFVDRVRDKLLSDDYVLCSEIMGLHAICDAHKNRRF